MSIIQNSEQRFISYKKLLEEVSRDKFNYPPNNEFVIWYKSHLRECKNSEELSLKKMVKDKTYENEGLNPPSFYIF